VKGPRKSLINIRLNTTVYWLLSKITAALSRKEELNFRKTIRNYPPQKPEKAEEWFLRALVC
jgi:hypothetical protein